MVNSHTFLIYASVYVLPPRWDCFILVALVLAHDLTYPWANRFWLVVFGTGELCLNSPSFSAPQADLKVADQLATALGVSLCMATDMADALRLMQSADYDVFVFNHEVNTALALCLQCGK